MNKEQLISSLVKPTDSKILMIVLDGLGDIGFDFKGTPLTEANTPNMDKLAHTADLGLSIPLGLGITPGSGPAHLALFGYDGIKHNVGRGLLSALGLGFDVKPGDLCVRLNFCNMKGNVVLDRRAGRIPTEENKKLVEKLNKEIKLDGIETFFITEKEHRTVLILRGKELGDKLTDSDPQKDGEKILKIEGQDEVSKKTAIILNKLSDQIREVLKDNKENGVIMRGYSVEKKLPSFNEKYKLKSAALALYPMYKGVAKLVGMDIVHGLNENADIFKALRSFYDKYNFFFVHFKEPDKFGEDGEFGKKQRSIEEIDKIIGKINTLPFETIIICGDHSTPASMSGHSWHGVPFLIKSKYSRGLIKAETFCEGECAKGELGNFPANEIMSLALANALKLRKFGA